MFAGANSSASQGADPQANASRPDADNMFGDVFEEVSSVEAP